MQNQLGLSGEKNCWKSLSPFIAPRRLDSWGILVERTKPKHTITKLSAICERLSRHYLSFVLRWRSLVSLFRVNKCKKQNILDGTKEYFWRTPPLIWDTEVSGVCWRVQMNFQAEIKCCYRSFSNQSQSVCYFSFCQWCRTIKTSYYSIASVWFYRESRLDDWITISLFRLGQDIGNLYFKDCSGNEWFDFFCFCDCEK